MSKRIGFLSGLALALAVGSPVLAGQPASQACLGRTLAPPPKQVLHTASSWRASLGTTGASARKFRSSSLAISLTMLSRTLATIIRLFAPGQRWAASASCEPLNASRPPRYPRDAWPPKASPT